MIREQIRALVAGGVPDINGRYALVSDLIGLGDEQPEVDLEAQHEILLRAARAIFADGLLLDSGESRLVDAHIERAKAQMELSENMTEQQRRNEGVGTPEFYSGVIEGLQLLRKDLVGDTLGHHA